MNIRSAQQSPLVRPNSNATAGAPAAKPEPSRFASAGDVKGAEGQANDLARGRLDAAGSGFQDRIDQLLQSGDLSREEAAAVSAAGAEFEALIERLDNALAEGGVEQDGKLQRAFHFALDDLRNDVRSALSGDASGRAASGVEASASRGSEARVEEDGSADLAARLAAAFESVDARLSGLAQQRGREGGAELQALQGKFGEVFSRLEGAVANGMNPDALGDLFERMMNGLRDSALQGGEADQPKLYDAKTAVTPLGKTQGHGSLDATA